MTSRFLIPAFVVVSLLTNCRQQKRRTVALSQAAMVDTASTSSPFVTKDNKGNIVLSYVKQVDSAVSIYCYAVSTDGGETFGKPIEIPSSANIHAHAENLPKIVFKPSGEIISVWGVANDNPRNAYSGLVYYAQSFDSGNTWSAAKRLVTDTSGYDQRYFDLAVLPDGEAAIIWLDNRKTIKSDGSALYMAKTSGKSGFQSERLISQPCCECCRTDLFIDSKNNLHVLYRAILSNNVRDMVHAVSSDQGKSFTPAKKISDDNWVINGCPHTGPAMTENNDGLYFTWFTAGTGTGVFLNRSQDNGTTFSPKDSLCGRAGRHPQITTLANNDVVVVWDESFEKDKKFTSRVGMEIKSAGGSTVKRYITDETLSCNYPVVANAGNKSALVAYTKNANAKSVVMYRKITAE